MAPALLGSSIHVVGVGARTPFGTKASAAAAAVRASLVVLGQHPFILDGNGRPTPGAVDPELDPVILGAARLVRLAESALREACAPLDAVPLRLSAPIYIGLPERRPGFRDQDAEAVRAGLTRFGGLPMNVSNIGVFAEGHAAGLTALAAGVDAMQHGACEMCVVGGLDSYFHPDTMEWLETNRQLALRASRAGFVPGEGAGFCLFMTDKSRRRFGLESLARVRSVAVGTETN